MNRITLLGLLIPGALTTGCWGGDPPVSGGGPSTSSAEGGLSTSSAGGGLSTSSVGGNAESSTVTTTGGGGAGAGGVGAGPAPAIDAGIQGCAVPFIEADGLCHPALDKCRKGSIPSFDQGCVPAGIVACADTFLEADGLCHVTMSKCPSGTFAVPSEGCVPIDGPAGCGAAPWGAIADGASTIWVDPSYAGGGNDGSKTHPVTTIAAGLALAPEGGRVALAAGNYAEAVVVKQSVELVGRCPSMVKITGEGPFGGSTATVAIGPTPAGVTLRNLKIGGGGQGIAVDGAAAAKVTIDGVWVKNAKEFGLSATAGGAIVEVKHSLFQGTLSTASGARGQGIVALAGATIVVDASVVINNLTAGISAEGAASELTFTNGLIEGTSARASDGLLGAGVLVNGGATATLTGASVVSNRRAGALVSGAGSAVHVVGSVIEKTGPQKVDNTLGMGVQADSGATATIEGSAIVANLLDGVASFDPGTEVTVEQTLVAGTAPQLSDGDGGDGIHGGTGGALHIAHSTVAGNSHAGVSTQAGGASVNLASSLVEANGSGNSGGGILVEVGSTATIDSSALAGNIGEGLVVRAGTETTVTHSLIVGTLPDVKGNNGLGILSFDAKSLKINTSTLLLNQGAGVLVRGELAMSGCVVRGVKLGRIAAFSLPEIDGIGDGVLVVQGADAFAEATVSSSSFEDCGRAGILFASSGGSIHGSEATKNRFGLVVQGAPGPFIGLDNAFVGNTEQDRLDGGMLPVP
jgi:hypothetical protein